MRSHSTVAAFRKPHVIFTISSHQQLRHHDGDLQDRKKLHVDDDLEGLNKRTASLAVSPPPPLGISRNAGSLVTSEIALSDEDANYETKSVYLKK